MVIYIVIIHDVNDNLDKEKYKAWIRKKGQLFIIYVWYSFRIMVSVEEMTYLSNLWI